MKIISAFLFLLITISITCAENDWKSRLYTPTLIDKIGNTYFIVVCFHHRILYSDDLSLDISKWNVLDDDIAGPHSIDSDGKIFVADNTGRHGLKVYRKQQNGKLALVQTLGPFGKRTHRIRYDKATKAFYVISSNSQHLTKLVRVGNELTAEYTKPLPFLKGAYTRSISIIDDSMYFTSGPGVITKVRYRDDSFTPLATYRVPEGMKSANDIFLTTDGWWYITSTPQRVVRAKSLEDLDAGKWQDVFHQLGCKGTPYYLAEFDGRIFLPEITQFSAIKSFVHGKNGEITDVKTHFDFGPPTEFDKARIKALPR